MTPSALVSVLEAVLQDRKKKLLSVHLLLLYSSLFSSPEKYKKTYMITCTVKLQLHLLILKYILN